MKLLVVMFLILAVILFAFSVWGQRPPYDTYDEEYEQPTCACGWSLIVLIFGCAIFGYFAGKSSRES